MWAPAFAFLAFGVEAIDGREGIEPSHEDLSVASLEDAELKADRSRLGSDGFLKRPLTLALGFVGRAAIVLEADFGAGKPNFAGLGLRRSDNDGFAAGVFDVEASPGRVGAIRLLGVLAIWLTAGFLLGVSLIGVKGGL